MAGGDDGAVEAGGDHRGDCSSLARCKCDCDNRDITEAEAVFRRDRESKYIVRFDGLVFCYPFVCLCCGVQIDVDQFCFGRSRLCRPAHSCFEVIPSTNALAGGVARNTSAAKPATTALSPSRFPS